MTSKIIPNIPIIGKNGKTPSSVDQAQKAQAKHIEGKVKELIQFAVEKEFTADELFLSCDVITKKLNNTFQEKVDVLKKEFQQVSVKEALLSKEE